MRHNGRTPLKASQMRPEHLSLRENEPRLAVCPDCDTWHRIKRSMILPHRDGTPVEKTERRYFGDKPSGGRRCDGSAQRIVIDITPEEWAERLLEAETTAAGRRTARPIRKPRPQAAPAPVQMPAATRPLREQLAEHLQSDCPRCRAGRCVRVIELRQRIRRTAEIASAPALPIYGQLRTAFREHRASCTPCKNGALCDAGHKLAARMTSIARQQLARTA
ncbi:hypothetical protein SHJG_p1075 (plasmid) [Streptomyces hygroscopicus subsp. jinggangensis 5008]|nr:hypothetical protein SHJG_p1075 [Streptomyces hygroscopicus subsp. jinggangensis 5008]AGF68360.1 hypothetical protein SHJGH_p1075 [Streptomyces hygroscopicus subsp. jinggangensis TL01]